jgi:hypothetical protein
MPEWTTIPGGINLNLPADYFSKPTSKLLAWLDANAQALRTLFVDQIRVRARAALGADITVLNDGDLTAQIQNWAKAHGYSLPGSGGSDPVRAGDPAALDKLKKIFSSVPTEVKWVGTRGSATISVSGLTAMLKSDGAKYTISGGWDGTMQFKTEVAGMSFSGSLGPQNWNLTFSMGKGTPDFASLKTVFEKGEDALEGVIKNLDKIDVNNPSKTKAAFAPYIDPIKAAVTAASQIAALRPGDWSIGGWVGGGMPGQSGSPGVSGGIRITIVF